MSVSVEFSKRAEDVHKRLTQTLGRVYAGLAGAGAGAGRERETVDDGGQAAAGSLSLSSAVSELEGLAESLRSLYEDHLHQLEREHSQYRTDSEGREQSTGRLLRDMEGENERLADMNQSLQRDLRDLQSQYRATDTSLKEKEREVGGLLEQLGAQQEDRRQAGAGREERVREAEEVAEQLRWRVREEERERGEGERELETSREMERSLRTALLEVRQQLEVTHQELGKTQQELHSTEATLATTSEELNIVKHQLQPKEEELQALQEKIADRTQQLTELLDRRSGDYSRQVQEEILAQSRAYDDLLRKIADHTPNVPSTSDRPLSPSRPLDLATCLRDFLNPHILPPFPSSPSSPLSSPRLPRNDDITTAYQRYYNTFTDFTQRVRVGEFRACPKSRLRLHRLQQWRHHFMEITFRPPTGLLLDESPLCDVITLMKGVAKKLSLTPNSLLVYTVDKTRISRGMTLRLWVLRQSLAPTLQYEADSLLSDVSLTGHRLTFVSLAEPLGIPSPLERWESVHRRVVGRLEETPMADVGGGGGGEGKRARADSMDMVDLESSKPTSQLLAVSSSGNEGETTEERHLNGRGSGGREVGVARRAGFHIKALLRLMCTSCVHGNPISTHYQHLEELHTSNYVT